MPGAVRQDEKLVPGVEIHEAPDLPSTGEHFPPPFEHEDSLDEVFPKPGVVKPAVLLHGQQGKTVHQDRGEQTHAVLAPATVFRVNMDPLHSADG